MTLQQQLKNGGALRYRRGAGFYVVRSGKQIDIDQHEAEQALRAGRLSCSADSPDKFGVYHFVMKASK